MSHKLLIVAIVIAITASCRNEIEHKTGFLEVDGKQFPSSLVLNNEQVDEVYEHLCRIYDIRRDALDDFTEGYVLALEAEKRHITVDTLKARYLRERLTERDVANYIEEEMVGDWLQSSDNPSQMLRTGSREGFTELKRLTALSLYRSYIDSLRKVHKVSSALLSPVKKKVETGWIEKRSVLINDEERYNPEADELLLVADPTCKVCRKAYRMLADIVGSHDAQIKCRVFLLAPSVDYTVRAVEAARRQGLAREALDEVMRAPVLIDSSLTSVFVDAVGLDSALFADEIDNEVIADEIDKYYLKAKKAGFVETPVVLLNGCQVYRGHEKNVIISHLDNMTTTRR